MRTGFSCREAYETAVAFFGEASVRFAGVDGIMYCRPLFDLIAFFGGAYALSSSVTFVKEGKPVVEYDDETLERAHASQRAHE
jgi:hypothetical protein